LQARRSPTPPSLRRGLDFPLLRPHLCLGRAEAWEGGLRRRPEMNHACSFRDKGRTLHPSAPHRRQVLIAQSMGGLQPSPTYTILFLDQPTKGGWCSDSAGLSSSSRRDCTMVARLRKAYGATAEDGCANPELSGAP